MRLSHQVMQATHAWVAKGRKASRQRQRRMMLAFAEIAEAQGARHPGQVGAKTAIAYWRAMRRDGKAYATQLDHWRALRELWRLWGKDAEPPKPRLVARTGE